MFGFSEGSDLGKRGEREVEVETIGRLGRAGGTYRAFISNIQFKYSVADDWRIAGGAAVSRYDLSNVPGYADRGQFLIEQLSGEVRYRLLDRTTAPVGLTLLGAPFVSFTDGVSGAPANRYGAQLVAIVDRTLIADSLFAALNLQYLPQRAHLLADNSTIDTSLAGLSGAAVGRLQSWLYAGGEARYFQAYDGLAFASLAGQALSLGPVLYAPVAKGVSVSAAWSAQVWGQARGDGGGLDLDNFDRNQVKLRLSFDL